MDKAKGSRSHHVDDGEEDEAQVGLTVRLALCIERSAQKECGNHRRHNADLNRHQQDISRIQRHTSSYWCKPRESDEATHELSVVQQSP